MVYENQQRGEQIPAITTTFNQSRYYVTAWRMW